MDSDDNTGLVAIIIQWLLLLPCVLLAKETSMPPYPCQPKWLSRLRQTFDFESAAEKFAS